MKRGASGSPIQTAFSLTKYENGSWSSLLSPTQLRVISVVGSGEVWLSSVGDTGAIFSFRDGAWLSITREDGLPGGAVTSIGQSLDSAFWLVIPDAGVARYEPNLGQVGTIHGRLLGRDMRQILAGTPVHIERESGEGQFTIRAQEAGGYRVRAFPGNYRVSVGGGQVRQVVVDSGKSTRLDFADIEFANTVIAGRGKTVRAGTGNRKGAFRNFSVADGLTSPQIFDIHQDQAGDIWFSTDVSGVTRFDGTYLTTFTTDDGMPDNWVNSIESDSKGNLWFGTRSGDLPPSMCPHPELGYGCGERFGDRFRCRWAIAQ